MAKATEALAYEDSTVGWSASTTSCSRKVFVSMSAVSNQCGRRGAVANVPT